MFPPTRVITTPWIDPRIHTLLPYMRRRVVTSCPFVRQTSRTGASAAACLTEIMGNHRSPRYRPFSLHQSFRPCPSLWGIFTQRPSNSIALAWARGLFSRGIVICEGTHGRWSSPEQNGGKICGAACPSQTGGEADQPTLANYSHVSLAQGLAYVDFGF